MYPCVCLRYLQQHIAPVTALPCLSEALGSVVSAPMAELVPRSLVPPAVPCRAVSRLNRAVAHADHANVNVNANLISITLLLLGRFTLCTSSPICRCVCDALRSHVLHSAHVVMRKQDATHGTRRTRTHAARCLTALSPRPGRAVHVALPLPYACR